MMKLIFLAGLVAVVLGDVSHLFNRPQPQYYNPGPTPAYKAGPQIRIIRFDNDANPDGSYRYAYETENGISAEESGQPKAIGPDVGTSAQGAFQYTSPEGVQVQIQYIADENGFQPTGNVLPTPPPIPEAILKSLQYNAAHPEPETYSPQPTYSPYRRF